MGIPFFFDFLICGKHPCVTSGTLQDLKKCIDTDFPVGSEPSALEREMEAHRAFADVRCRVYIGRQEYFQKIEDYFSTHKAHPLVILGESGK